jgi:predicted Ser/Thr protein kinase
VTDIDDSRPSLSFQVSGDSPEWKGPDSDAELASLLTSLAAAPPVAPRALRAWRAPESLVGETLAHFVVQRLLGVGGLGVVYLARDRRLDRAVALKVLAPPTHGDVTTRERVLREARAAARVNDPAVAAIYEVGESDGVTFIAMEYVEGETLRAALSRGPLPVPRVVRLGAELAHGLSRAHAQGVVHRDLKPENVLLDVGAGGRAKILDFGIAAEHGARSSSSGTPVYMAPEQREAAVADVRSDVYALGVVLHECLTGPVGRIEPTALAAGAPQRLARIGCPAALARIVERCIAVDPSGRFEDGAAVARALDALMQADQRHRSRWKTIAAGAVALVAGVGGLAVGALRRHVGEDASGASSTAAAADRTRLRRLTANVPEQPILGSSLSPDGRILAWSDATGLHIVKIGTSEAQSIPFVAGESPQLVRWFDDGRRVAVTVASAGKDERDLRVIDTTTLAEVTLARGAFTALAVSSSSGASPSRDRVAYAEDDAVGWLDVAEPAVHHRAASKGAGCFIGDLAWSPAGTRIAFASLCFASLAETTLETVGTDGAPPSLVMREPRLFNDMARAGVAWRAGGDLVFSLAEWLPAEPGSNVWSVAVDEGTGRARGERRQLTHWTGVIAASFSADRAGDRMAFVRYDVQTDIYVAGLTAARSLAGAPTRLTLKERNERAPAWAADGSGVFYTSDENGNFDIFFQDLMGHAPSSVAASRDWETGPIVTPDGAHLLYWRLRPVGLGEATSADLMLRSLRAPHDDRVLRPGVTSHPAGMGRPPPWESRVRCASGRGAGAGACFVSQLEDGELRLTRIALDGSSSTPVFRAPDANAATNFWDVSADGAWLAIPVANGPVRIASIAGVAPSRDLAMPAGCDPGVLAWSKDQRGIFVAAECAEEPTFRLYDLPIDGPAHLVWQDAPNYLLEPEPSPDGQSLAIAVKRPDDDVWLVDGM